MINSNSEIFLQQNIHSLRDLILLHLNTLRVKRNVGHELLYQKLNASFFGSYTTYGLLHLGTNHTCFNAFRVKCS